MSDIGSLYVKLGLNDSGFQAGIKRTNQELRSLKSSFKLAGAVMISLVEFRRN